MAFITSNLSNSLTRALPTASIAASITLGASIGTFAFIFREKTAYLENSWLKGSLPTKLGIIAAAMIGVSWGVWNLSTTKMAGIASGIAAFTFAKFIHNLRTGPVLIGPFSIIEANPKEWTSVTETVHSWKKAAFEKYKKIHGGNIPNFRTRDMVSSDEGTLFKASMNITQSIEDCLSNPLEQSSDREPWNRVLLCRDRSGKVQAAALIEKKEQFINEIKLAYIVTHPDNLKHKINETITTRVQGSGSAIIFYLAQTAIKMDATIRTRATEDAKPFYEKCGFIEAPEDSKINDGISGIVPMKLTKQKMESLISKGFPFTH